MKLPSPTPDFKPSDDEQALEAWWDRLSALKKGRIYEHVTNPPRPTHFAYRDVPGMQSLDSKWWRKQFHANDYVRFVALAYTVINSSYSATKRHCRTIQPRPFFLGLLDAWYATTPGDYEGRPTIKRELEVDRRAADHSARMAQHELNLLCEKRDKDKAAREDMARQKKIRAHAEALLRAPMHISNTYGPRPGQPRLYTDDGPDFQSMPRELRNAVLHRYASVDIKATHATLLSWLAEAGPARFPTLAAYAADPDGFRAQAGDLLGVGAREAKDILGPLTSGGSMNTVRRAVKAQMGLEKCEKLPPLLDTLFHEVQGAIDRVLRHYPSVMPKHSRLLRDLPYPEPGTPDLVKKRTTWFSIRDTPPKGSRKPRVVVEKKLYTVARRHAIAQVLMTWDERVLRALLGWHRERGPHVRVLLHDGYYCDPGVEVHRAALAAHVSTLFPGLHVQFTIKEPVQATLPRPAFHTWRHVHVDSG